MRTQGQQHVKLQTPKSTDTHAKRSSFASHISYTIGQSMQTNFTYLRHTDITCPESGSASTYKTLVYIRVCAIVQNVGGMCVSDNIWETKSKTLTQIHRIHRHSSSSANANLNLRIV